MPEEKRTQKIGIYLVLLVLACLVVAYLSLCTSPGPSTSKRTPTPRPPTPTSRATAAPVVYDVEYRLGGTAKRASITIANETGGTEQRDSVSVTTWTKAFQAKRGQFVYLAAQNKADRGRIRCEIWVDGELWKEAESAGAYAIATCSGSVGRE
jgi:hypothetical protein